MAGASHGHVAEKQPSEIISARPDRHLVDAVRTCLGHDASGLRSSKFRVGGVPEAHATGRGGGGENQRIVPTDNCSYAGATAMNVVVVMLVTRHNFDGTQSCRPAHASNGHPGPWRIKAEKADEVLSQPPPRMLRSSASEHLRRGALSSGAAGSRRHEDPLALAASGRGLRLGEQSAV